MKITYSAKADLAYIRIDDTPQPVINRRMSDDIVVDIGENGRIVGIEILDASQHLDISNLMRFEYHATA